MTVCRYSLTEGLLASHKYDESTGTTHCGSTSRTVVSAPLQPFINANLVEGVPARHDANRIFFLVIVQAD